MDGTVPSTLRDRTQSADLRCGFREFHAGSSDLDPLILIDGDYDPSREQALRSSILQPLVRDNAWLNVEDRSAILAGAWDEIPSISLKFPLYSVAALESVHDRLTTTRKWQIILESEPIYNFELYRKIYQSLVPSIPTTTPLGAQKQPLHPDLRTISHDIGAFFSSFGDPTFLFKDALKFWKTNFLREFYYFATSFSIVLAWHLEQDHVDLPLTFFKGSTGSKILRLLEFGKQLDQIAARDRNLEQKLLQSVEGLIARFKIPKQKLLSFPGHYQTEAAQILNGLTLGLLSRFASCWAAIHESHTVAVLNALPKDQINVQSFFPPVVQDPNVARIVADLTQMRDAYLRNMGALAEVIQLVGTAWNTRTRPLWLSELVQHFVVAT